MPKCELCGDLLAATVKPLKTVPLSGKLTNTVSRGYGIRGPVLGFGNAPKKREEMVAWYSVFGGHGIRGAGIRNFTHIGQNWLNYVPKTICPYLG